MTAIDLSPQIADIRGRYERYWASFEALQELRALWGNPECNDCGVFEAGEEIRVGLEGERCWYGEVQIARAVNGWFAVGTSYGYSLGGGGYAPSLWNRTAYTDRDEALVAGLDELVRKFESLLDWGGSDNTDAVKRKAARMIAALQANQASVRQLDLFL